MKRTILVVGLIAFIAMAMVSCTAQRTGCKNTYNYIGYGSR
ncbi:MAG TPA: hypothetical protein VKR32_18740 [Puia sp.]|nr:hypothetical protein [Puia sp.]